MNNELKEETKQLKDQVDYLVYKSRGIWKESKKREKKQIELFEMLGEIEGINKTLSKPLNDNHKKGIVNHLYFLTKKVKWIHWGTSITFKEYVKPDKHKKPDFMNRLQYMLI